MLTALTFFIILGLLVFVHELGHFAVARYFGVACDEFGFGFPPRAFGFYKRGGKWLRVWGNREITDHDSTVYSINWIPLGGFVKIKGENDSGNHEPDSFGAQAIWKRALILAAGVIMNVVLAWFILFIAFFATGLPESYDPSQAGNKHYSDPRIQITQIIPNSPAASSGIKAGDVIISIDNQSFASTAAVQDFIKTKAGTPVVYQLRRGGEFLSQTITPQAIQVSETEQIVGIGVQLDHIATARYPWYQALYRAAISVYLLLMMILVGLGQFFAKLFQGEGSAQAVAGPIGIYGITGQMVDLGLAYVLQFSAALSVNLAVLNILPIPALDGGRLFFLLIEKIRGKVMNRQLELVFNNVFFLLLIALIIVVTVIDISKLGCLSCQLKNLVNKF
jgi:regulator of sigma E protease